MWFGTYDGLNKFDGYSFRTYKGSFDDKTALLNYRIDNIKEDCDGYLWIQTYNGITYRFDPRTERFLAIPQCLPEYKQYKLSLKGIFTLRDSSIWITGGSFGEDDCFRVINTKNSDKVQVTHYNVNNSQLTSNKINNIYLDKKKNTWILTSKGINLLKRNTTQPVRLFKENNPGAFYTICENYPLIYLGGEHGRFCAFDYRS
jgi:hypothetical protein